MQCAVWYTVVVMITTLSAAQFNFIEGWFWLLLGAVCLVLYRLIPTPYRTLTLYAAFILVTFGVSDFVEAYYGSFLVPGMEWLFIWKALDVIGLISIVLWYGVLRIRN
ncbi:MAG: hypothetical protein RLZZ360_68 [Candidatus Parcubacteria bacterium]